jgi:hypothetical protein
LLRFCEKADPMVLEVNPDAAGADDMVDIDA